MARPHKNTVDYFPWKVSLGEKRQYINKKYGNDGVATWLIILEKLSLTDYHYIDLSTTYRKAIIAENCNISFELFKNIVDDLVMMGFFDAYLWENNSVIWCQDFIESIQDAYNKRRNDCITYEQLCDYLASNENAQGELNLKFKGNNSIKDYLNRVSDTVNPDKVPDNTQSKVKQSKVKESKGNNTKEYTPPPFDDFLKYALEKKGNVCQEHLRNKYDAWVENGWKDGRDNPVKNWKSKLNQTIPYIRENKGDKKTFEKAPSQATAETKNYKEY